METTINNNKTNPVGCLQGHDILGSLFMLTRNVWSTGATAINSLKTALQALLLGLIFVLLPPTTYAYKIENAESGHDHLVSRALQLFQEHYIFEELNETISKDYDQLFRVLKPWDSGIIGGCFSDTFDHRTLKKDKDKDEDEYTYGRLIISGARNEDEIDVVYENFDHVGLLTTHIQNLCGVRTTFTHFWVADKGPEKKVRGLSTAATCEKAAGKFPNSWMKIATGAGTKAVHSVAPSLWDQAIDAYRSGNKERAYERLGHVAHLLQDQTLGAHAHGDFHGATHGAGVLDAYEEWTANMDLDEWLDVADWNKLKEFVDLPSDSQIFNSLSSSWREGIPGEKNKRQLFYLVYTANQHGDFFPSWRKNSDIVGAIIPSYKGSKQCDGNTDVLTFNDGTPWVDYNDGTWPKDLLDGEYGNVHINVFNKSPPRHVEYHARKSYVYAIRATATLFKLFLETVGAEITPRPPSCEVDLSPPEITAPDDVIVEQTSPSGTAVDLGSPIVVDNCDTDPVVDNDAPAVFPQGSTVVTWWATDSSGNISSMAVQLVTVEDTTDPVVTAALVPTADKGVFEVEFSCVDVADPSATATGEINGTFVADGQMVKLTIKKQTRVWQHDGLLEIRAPTFSLVATCIDFSGNVGAATATPVMDGPIAR